ncbi:PhzF family phenazine biosynthesis protein [Limisalsivibrio acetivorans]|uniref:PhzF family phenazine biosynthesis protein n=1 Tax=Limisalsivibrio acetivorans TaxID=1304888 RepID=UPI0003B4C7AB|nr:PhzF family phenazine biosynthesis isomerase [Limisalsivibrio acetivorans]
MKLNISIADAFTKEPFKGNPAGVCITETELDAGLMQSIAMEMGQSETAFTYLKNGERILRWFTPLVEVDLCGHATLATAHIMREEGLTDGRTVEFSTRSGKLKAEYSGDEIILDFPTGVISRGEMPEGLDEAIGADVEYIGESGFMHLVRIGSEKELVELKPDMTKLAKAIPDGVIVTCPSKDYDFVSRMFAPAIGINEDPVTGSAHCILSSYWHEVTDKTEFNAYQASPRGGGMYVRYTDERTYLRSSARTSLKGIILV